MNPKVNLKELASRESEQVEWKRSVADTEDVLKTLAAFANDLQNLGGGYVVCGAEETRDEHGFPKVEFPGLEAARFREIENKCLNDARTKIHPPLTPLVEELPGAVEGRRVLVFIMPATGQAHTYRADGKDASTYYVRVGRQTVEARNGVFRELMVRKGAVEPWDRQPCKTATINDLDLLALRDTLQRIGVFSPQVGVEPFLSDTEQLSPFVPPLCAREPLTNLLRPRNFAILLFGLNVTRFVPGAFALYSRYPGTDRATPHSEREELAGNLIVQAYRLNELLDREVRTVFDKTDSRSPNIRNYPPRALQESMINVLAHRDYSLVDPTRLTVFADRIEMISPGPLLSGVDPQEFSSGRARPKWRNQALAWFLNRLQLAQAEGQGIRTILSSMLQEGCPPPVFETNEAHVICTLPANPRYLKIPPVA